MFSLCHRTHLEEIILCAAVFPLGVGRRSELERTRVDVEASVLCGEGCWYKLIVLWTKRRLE